MKATFCFIFFSMTLSFFGQELTGNQLLEKAIAYHDPSGQWQQFQSTFVVTMKSPGKSVRKSLLHIDLPKDYFSVQATTDNQTKSYTLDKGNCTLLLNGRKVRTDKEKQTHRLTCDRALLYKNYYTYLYGLPMKLKDKGTIIDPKVRTKTFKGKTYKVLKVTYEKSIGEDTWYFYFDPSTYAMEVYQFFHEEQKNDGEYILLSGELLVNDIKMPQDRAWYMNKDDRYLGTDMLTHSKH